MDGEESEEEEGTEEEDEREENEKDAEEDEEEEDKREEEEEEEDSGGWESLIEGREATDEGANVGEVGAVDQFNHLRLFLKPGVESACAAEDGGNSGSVVEGEGGI